MITLLEGYPDNVLAISASGHVSAEDYRKVLIPEAEARLRRHDHLRFLYQIGADFQGFAPGAMLADAGFGLGHLKSIGRTALVTDIGWIAQSAQLFSALFPAPFRVFPNSEMEKAKVWVSQDGSAA